MPDYGEITDSVKNSEIVISPEDFSRHGYAVGATGTGKTTIALNIVKHLEMANMTGEFPNAVIYIDPKGDDAYKFLRQADQDTINQQKLNYMDPMETGFGCNPLELPAYDKEERSQVVSRYIGYFMDIIKQWYNQNQSFVQMERMFRLLLQYLYMSTDNPTFLDIYDLIIKLQDNNGDSCNSKANHRCMR